MPNPVNLNTLRQNKKTGDKFACVTAYDASFASVLAQAGVDILLVGDSLGMVIQGYDSTLPVTVADIVYHCQAVRRGAPQGFLMADMPFMSDATPKQALANAGRIIKEGGAQMVKLEGGAYQVKTVEKLANQGVAVCAHLGLLPQSIHKLGAYKVQGKDPAAAQTILKDAMALQAAGADLMLLECVPASLAAEITANLSIPVIGIGAGVQCDGQVLVLQDILGLGTQFKPRFAKNFLQGRDSIQDAVAAYVTAVKRGEFPGPEHSFS